MQRLALIGTLALVGCAQPGPKQLYQWDGYQSAVYQYLKSYGGEPGAQIAALEAQLQKNQANGVASPPGMRAHLGLLHAKMGDEDAARRYLEAEKAQFPESATYVDFLLKNNLRNAAAAPPSAASQPKS